MFADGNTTSLVSSPSRRRKGTANANHQQHNGAATTNSRRRRQTTTQASSSNDRSSPERGKRRRDNLLFFYHQRNCIPVVLLTMTCAVLGGVALYHAAVQKHVVPGLYVAHNAAANDNTPYFTPAPVKSRRTACVDQAQTTVVRAFQQQGWTVVPLNRKSDDPDHHYITCYQKGSAAIIWTKLIPHYWNASHSWQRHNQLPFETDMSKKAKTTELLRAYYSNNKNNAAHNNNNKPQPGDIKATTALSSSSLSFLPESYVLPADRDALLRRLTFGRRRPDNHEVPSLRGSTANNSNEPWVIKLSAIDNGVGISMLGPGSEQLELLTKILWQAKQGHLNEYQYMKMLRRRLVFQQQQHQQGGGTNDTRKATDIAKAQNRTERMHDKIIVQRYVCHEMDYQGRKFDLRVYFLIASVDPLVVYVHDGYLRVSPHAYNEGKFESTAQHLTNLGRNAGAENNTISYEQWQVELRQWVNRDPSRFSWNVRRNPLQHIRNQIKSALAELVAATRQHAFRGYRSYTNMENGFALFGGDFIVDRDLNVWFTEGQDSPGLLHETTMKRKLNDRLLPASVDIIGQVLDKQSTGQPLFPMHQTGDFELIYTDDYHYRYDFERKTSLGPCDTATTISQ